MPTFTNADVNLYYEIHGSGYPVLAIAPGGMRSTIQAWENAPWNPVSALAEEFRVIAMDQRNAGRSSGPVHATDGWQTYTADQLALLDHLKVDRCHVIGMCIGGPYVMGLIEAAPERISAAVMFQPIGLTDNRAAFYQMFDGWADTMRERSDASDEAWRRFREAMYGGDDFLFNVDEQFVSRCPTPLLVLLGDDLYHPSETSRRICELAPDAALVERWKSPEDQAAARDAVAAFLRSHSRT